MKYLSEEEVNLLRQNARSIVRELGLLNDAYFDIGVTLAERHLLIELSSTLYPTVGEIAERLLLDKSTASRLIKKAIKKGYIQSSLDENDKRKRYLQFTEEGKKILHTFEPIAFNQTKEALLSLKEEEIEQVYRGIELYAKGLKHSRLRNKIAIEQIKRKDCVSLTHLLTDLGHQSLDNLFQTYQKKGFFYVVMKMESKIIGGAGISPYEKKSHHCRLEKVGLKSNMRGFGFEKILIDFCMKEAKKRGYNHCYVDTKEDQFSYDFQKQGFQMIKKNHKEILLCKAF